MKRSRRFWLKIRSGSIRRILVETKASLSLSSGDSYAQARFVCDTRGNSCWYVNEAPTNYIKELIVKRL